MKNILNRIAPTLYGYTVGTAIYGITKLQNKGIFLLIAILVTILFINRLVNKHYN